MKYIYSNYNDNTVASALVLCSVDTNMNSVVWNGNLTSDDLAHEVFEDNFETFMNITYEKTDDHWATYAAFTVSDGKVRLRPPTKTNICALVQ